ncbi:MAG: 2,4-dihydroxyhept-2-ene-1,7-dioic acid aldolase [Chloroflexi bacterium]|nr:2,4-dihydroxyhept-2-ene-1,7-dioic acid aldolase [Chloroflexota bacterium]
MGLRELWDGEAPTLGGWAAIPCGFSAEVLGYCGFDWVCIDTQHGMIGYDQMLSMVQGLSITRTPAIVRVSWNNPGEITKALDAGAQGALIPMVNSAEEAQMAVAACRYPPDGIRSWGPTRAALGRPDYNAASTNRDIICAVMVETSAGLDRLDEIVTTPGIDAIFVGPNDLALSSGFEPSLRAENPAHHQKIGSILAACQRHDMVAGIMCGSLDMAIHWRELGFRMLALASDAALLRSAAQEMLRTLRAEGQATESKGAYA